MGKIRRVGKPPQELSLNGNFPGGKSADKENFLCLKTLQLLMENTLDEFIRTIFNYVLLRA